MKDYYKILGVGEEASEEEIRACWIELTKRYHPDLRKTEEGDEKIREINEAYETLKDESARFQYDFERGLKRSFVKKAHLRQKRRMNIRKTVIVPSSAILVLCLIAGFFLLRSGRVSAPQKTEALNKSAKGSAERVALQTPSVTTDRKAREETRTTEKIKEAVTPLEGKKETAPQAGKAIDSSDPPREAGPLKAGEEARLGVNLEPSDLSSDRRQAPGPRAGESKDSLSVRPSPVVEERRSPPPERRKPEAREKLARQVVTKPEMPAINRISKEIPEEVPKRDVREPLKEIPKQVAKEAPREIVREVPKEMVALPRVLPKEASKEVQKETPKEAAEQPAGEILKDVPKEIPKQTPQPIAKEVVKEAPKEIPRTPATEVTRGASKEVPKEVPKEIPAVVVRDVVKEVPKEAPQEAAQVTLHPGVKLTMWAKEEKTEKTVALRPSLHAQEDEVRHFFENYVDRYRRKDAVGFLSCFSTQAVQNQTEGFDAIRSIYTKWIDQSEELRYQIEGMKIEIYQQRVDVKARFRVEQKLKKDGAEKVWKGSIRWVLVKEGGRLKIRSLDYQNERSR